MSRKSKLFTSALVVGVLGSFVALGVFGLFSATTQNAGNEITTGTVALSDNDAGQAMFNINGAKPGDTWTRCIKVSYTGSLPADVHTYFQRTPGPLEQYLNLKMEQGTQATSTFPGCTGFTPQAVGQNSDGVVADGPLNAAPAQGSFEVGLPLTPVGQTVWNSGDSLVFRMTMTLSAAAPDNIQGQSTGTQAAIWEARNDT